MEEALPLQERSSAFVLSIVAGVLILLGGFVRAIYISALSTGSRFPGLSRLAVSVIGPTGLRFGTAIALMTATLVIVSGILVLVGAVMLDLAAQRISIWGVVIVVFSALGLFAGGGFLATLGSLLGMVGGVLAITLTSASRSV